MADDTAPPAQSYCTRKPVPGQVIGAGCEDCGHALVLHVGVEHCPVCELVDLNRQLYRIVEGGPHAALMRAALHGKTPPSAYLR